MQLFYKPKHLKAEEANNHIYRFLIIILMIVFCNICGILAYFTSDDSVTNNFTIAGIYTVRFNANDGSGNISEQKIYVGLSTNLNSNTFIRSGYQFAGWNTVANGSGTSYTNAQSVTNLASANSVIDLYAQWTQSSGVAIVNGVYYQTLQAAINAVPNDSPQTLVTLLTDVDERITIGSRKNILFDLQNHTVTNSTSGATISNSGMIEIQNGTITKDPSVEYAVIDNNESGTLKITGGSVLGVGTNKSQSIYNCGVLEISGTAYLHAETTNRATILSEHGGTVTITGGTIISENNSAISNIRATNGTVPNGGLIIIGTQDGVLDITTPVLQGKNYGINAIADSVEIYDGILKGENHAINNEAYITTIENVCRIENGTEVIDGDTYETLYLVAENEITFDANGGSVSPGFKCVDVGDPIGALPVPVWAGHIFIGWFTDPTNGVQINENTTVGSGDTYYAHWVESRRITFYPEQGTVNPGYLDVELNTAPTTLPTPTRPGYVFDGWFTQASGGTQITTSTVITQDVDAYAQWHMDSVRAYFDANQGTVDTLYKDVPTGTEIGSLPTPTRLGYYFNGWFTDPTDGYRIHEDEIVSADTYYYAHWITNPVAHIGDIYFESLQLAIRDVPTTNSSRTIVLDQNTKEAVEVIPNQTVTIDLNGYTLSNDGTKKLQSIIGTDARALVIENSGTLTLTNGTISAKTSQSAINNNAILIVDGASISNIGTRQSIYNNGGTVEITGNAYISCSASDRATIQSNKPSGATSAGTITIYSGTIVSTKAGTRGVIENPSTGVVNVYGGTIISNNGMGIDNKGVLNLGEEDGTIGDTSPVIQGKTYGVKNSATFNFYDGIVKGITDSINGSVSNTEAGATRVDGNDGTYNTTYYQ